MWAGEQGCEGCCDSTITNHGQVCDVNLALQRSLTPAHPLVTLGGVAKDFLEKKRGEKEIILQKKIVVAIGWMRFNYFCKPQWQCARLALAAQLSGGVQQKPSCLARPGELQVTSGKLQVTSGTGNHWHPPRALGGVTFTQFWRRKSERQHVCPLLSAVGTERGISRARWQWSKILQTCSSIPQAQWVCQKWLIILQLGQAGKKKNHLFFFFF